VKESVKIDNLRKIEGAYINENMIIYLIQIIGEYKLTDKLDYFILNNAESNDTCFRSYLRTSLSDIGDEVIKARKIRYFGHVVNLAAKAFLFGKNADAYEIEDTMNMIFDR
jgi:hypothetical protein